MFGATATMFGATTATFDTAATMFGAAGATSTAVFSTLVASYFMTGTFSTAFTMFAPLTASSPSSFLLGGRFCFFPRLFYLARDFAYRIARLSRPRESGARERGYILYMLFPLARLFLRIIKLVAVDGFRFFKVLAGISPQTCGLGGVRW